MFFLNRYRIVKTMKRALAASCALALLAGAGLAEAIPETADLGPSPLLDDQADSVRTAQRRLIQLGLLGDSADGVYGPRTGEALRAYQSQNGLDASGHLDAATLDSLTHVDIDSLSAKDVQQRLIDLGYLRGVADGVIGPRSIAALKLFQKLNGLEANGKAGRDTLEALYAADAMAMPGALTPGSKGDDVLRLQQRLQQFGFFEGTPDGNYGKTTTAAVRAFQQHLLAQGHSPEEIAEDGVAGAMTLYWLYDAEYSTYLRDVAPGQSDSEVQRIERRLSQLGYIDLPADEVLDEYTVIALELYRDQASFYAPGPADKETVDSLFADTAPQAEYCVPHDIASGDRGQVVRDVEEALVRGGMLTKQPKGEYSAAVEDAIERLYAYLVSQDDPNAALFADPKALNAQAVETLVDGLLCYRQDSAKSDAEVRRVQSRLYTLLYLDKAGVDGKLGSDSRAALKAFQSANGLSTTGKADGDTMDLLFTAEARSNPYPYRVEVSIDDQTVTVYELNDNKKYDQVQRFTCSTGLHNSTPRGVFLDGHPVNRWHYFEKFNCWAQYSFEVTGDIMFHSVIYGSNNEHSLRSGSLHALGNPASHGCIRLKVEDAKWLFEHCKKGKAVIVIS